ncbi:uncharacterized protein LOC110467510 isoform X5 [Mizuhopecten yessoensis]|uniref:3'-5' exonuclease domain-containing protein n=1 Tax=Mizuhopecten yessoensis TaxID=6573 RepID=A0A210PLM1_MIZYE|nr:uncharacterized protein LOC110467510 isoform X3 [Mizuhopecten yessoensis]XP_021380393.1 uncharacterized protein LOC110467510 isoform X3 [Mizuhopecten yessoensis]XP_021380394.1 uncharacterized protein LOC110467510 isoform X4 [Mizuhopecten yessoensis]XP_021380395.1 uncharacterized protein LOC110467510 isoform X3 [Mizuhopecten yessoensis]XP_021380396.1 uncharacterized protein LOC110467510 isoform X3 [Mizuhopecten yessoensis]XP_021380397.1 uncharacterized protein LOC110467510 isoform X5 [Mizuho
MSFIQPIRNLISDPDKANEEFNSLLEEKVIGVRMESGSKPERPGETILSLIIVSRTFGQVLVFDVLQSPEILQDKWFKTLMESERPIKVMFHPEHDSKLLWRSSNISLHGVFDPQTLQMVKESIEKRLPTRKLGYQRQTLTDICRLYGVECDYDKGLVKKMLEQNSLLFMERSNIRQLMTICEDSAECLIPLYDKMKRELHIAVVKDKYSQMLEECLYGGPHGANKDDLKKQRLIRDYLETKQFRKEHGHSALTKGDKQLLRRGRLSFRMTFQHDTTKADSLC